MPPRVGNTRGRRTRSTSVAITSTRASVTHAVLLAVTSLRRHARCSVSWSFSASAHAHDGDDHRRHVQGESMHVRQLLIRTLMCALLVGFASPAFAQSFTGRIDVTVADSTGAVLPGVMVEVTGPQNHSAVTDAAGEVHLLNLAPCVYTVSAKVQGFGDYMNSNGQVVAGGGVPLRVVLAVAGMAEGGQVTAEPPTIDPKKMTTSTNVTNDQLQELPSSRDPWVVLQTVPGIIVDRVNVGGAESGQQSSYQAKGSSGGDNTWYVDGIAITDMAALGSSPTYYDFDMFQEMQVTTGGADVTMATGGVGLNFVLKSGSNTPRGSARVYYE